MGRIKVQVPGGNFKSIQTGGSTVVNTTIVQQSRVAVPPLVPATGGGTTVSGANPSATIGLSVIDGSATTYMRSDGAPPLSQAIVPTWTGLHTFDAGIVINAPSTAINALTVLGYSSAFAVSIEGYDGSSDSYGLSVNAGIDSTDVAVRIENYAASDVFLEIFGDGHGTLGPNATNCLSWTVNGAFAIAAPTSGAALVVNGLSNEQAMEIAAGSTSGESYGLSITAGTTSADEALLIRSQNGSNWFLSIEGDGGIRAGSSSLTNEGLGTINVSGGFYVSGTKLTGGGSTLITILQSGGASQTVSVPAGAHWCRAVLIAGGGGGGGGQKTTTAATAAGGGGGGAGAISIYDFLASDVGSSPLIVFSNYSTGGAGGLGATTAAAGGSGTAGSNISFETNGGNKLLFAVGGAIGTGGSGGTGGSAGQPGTYGMSGEGTAGGSGGNAAPTLGTPSPYGLNSYCATGGGGGAAATSATGQPGNAGGGAGTQTMLTIAGGIAGTAGSGTVTGGTGGTGSSTSSFAAAGGGGAGSASGSHSGGAGGPGSGAGAGGGGGGGCYDSTGGNGGNGGAGGPAIAYLLFY